MLAIAGLWLRLAPSADSRKTCPSAPISMIQRTSHPSEHLTKRQSLCLVPVQTTSRSRPDSRVTPTFLDIVGSDQRFRVWRIYCVGRNYLAHIREMGEGDERDPPFFQKPADAIVTDGRVPYPTFTDDFQFEFELVIAIGSEAVNVSPDAALDHVSATPRARYDTAGPPARMQ